MRFMRMFLGGILLGASISAFPSAAFAAETELPAVAVMDFGANNAPATEAAVMSDFVRSAAIRAGKWRVVDKKNMQAILAEQAFQQTGCTSSECAVKMGKLLNVQKMVVGEYVIMAGVRYLTAHVVSVETGVMEKSGKVKGFNGEEADAAADDLVDQLTGVKVSALDRREPKKYVGLFAGFVFGFGSGKTLEGVVAQGTKGTINYRMELQSDGKLETNEIHPAFGVRGIFFDRFLLTGYVMPTGGAVPKGEVTAVAAGATTNPNNSPMEYSIQETFAGGANLCYVWNAGSRLRVVGGGGIEIASYDEKYTSGVGGAEYHDGNQYVNISTGISGDADKEIRPLILVGLEWRPVTSLGVDIWLRYRFAKTVTGKAVTIVESGTTGVGASMETSRSEMKIAEYYPAGFQVEPALTFYF